MCYRHELAEVGVVIEASAQFAVIVISVVKVLHGSSQAIILGDVIGKDFHATPTDVIPIACGAVRLNFGFWETVRISF